MIVRSEKRKLLAAQCAVVAGVVASASMAFAHGGMASPDELGQPLALAGALAFVSYWAVMLWPSRKRNSGAGTNAGKAPNRRRNNRRVTSGGRSELRAVSLKAMGRGSDG